MKIKRFAFGVSIITTLLISSCSLLPAGPYQNKPQRSQKSSDEEDDSVETTSSSSSRRSSSKSSSSSSRSSSRSSSSSSKQSSSTYQNSSIYSSSSEAAFSFQPPTETWIGHRANSFAGGSGSSSDPYLITNPKELAYLSYIGNDTNATSGKYYKLMADLDMSGWEWTPIGYCIQDNWDSRGFSGHFDGNGCTIYNLTITQPTKGGYDNGSYIGLFGWAWNNAVISNVTLSNYQYVLGFSVNPNRINSGFGQMDALYIGAIVGELRGSPSITGCSADGVCYINNEIYPLNLVGSVM